MGEVRTLEVGQRVKHRTGQLGVVVAQPDGDPVVRLDGESRDRVFYRSEIQPLVCSGHKRLENR